MKIEYICKFCRRPFAFECEAPDPCLGVDLEKWKAMLCCNPCHDYERSRRDNEDAIRKQVGKLLIARHGKKSDDPRVLKEEEPIRAALTALTKSYAAIICRHANTVNYWELTFVEHIMARPDLAGNTLHQYRRTIERPA